MNTSKKDPLMRLVYDHENISEFVDNYEQIMQLKYFKQDWNSPDTIINFFRHSLTEHIAFEEKKIFPAVIEHSKNQSLAKPLIEDLLKDHDEMKSMLSGVLTQLENMNFPLKESEYSSILDCILPLLEKMQTHAAREDDKLVPLVKGILHVFEDSPDGEILF